MMFWLAALAMLGLAGLLLAWPLLARGSSWRATGLAIVLLLPLGGALLYRDVGTPAAMNPAIADASTRDFNAMTDDLKSRLSERPEDLEGWLLLARSLKSMERFDEAQDALETASRIAPDNPLVQVELAEAMLFASGDPTFSDEVRGMLQSALQREPNLQKALWLLGIDASQRFDDETAVDLWQRLLTRLEPGSPVAESVQQQISLAQERLGVSGTDLPDDESDWAGVDVRIELGDSARQSLPEPLPDSAVLFLIVRPAGEASGPPLGVARVETPDFPLQITVDDSNAMLPQRKLSSQAVLSVQARLSLSGTTTAGPGDWESAAAEAAIDEAGAVSLTLDNGID